MADPKVTTLSLKLLADGTGDITLTRLRSQAQPGMRVEVQHQGSTLVLMHLLRFTLGALLVSTSETESRATLYDSLNRYAVALTFTGSRCTNWILYQMGEEAPLALPATAVEPGAAEVPRAE